MTHFVPVQAYRLDTNGVTDETTLRFAADLVDVYGALYQGMAPIGEWIQARVASLVRGWLPGWLTSHGHLVDPARPSVQSRSWDIIVHRPLPADEGYPPPATPEGPFLVVPKHLCCAVIDTKGRYNTPQEYARAVAFDSANRCATRQLEFIGAKIVPVLFIIASNYDPKAIMLRGHENGLRTFVMAKAVDGKRPDGSVSVIWRLYPGTDSLCPLLEFRDVLLQAASQWEVGNGQAIGSR